MCGDTSGLTLALRATRWRGLTPLTQKVSCDSQKVSGDAWLGGAAPYISGYLCGINCSQQEKFFASGLTYGLVRTSMGTEPLIDQKRSAVMRGWGGGSSTLYICGIKCSQQKKFFGPGRGGLRPYLPR